MIHWQIYVYILSVFTSGLIVSEWYIISGLELWWYFWHWHSWGLNGHHVLSWLLNRGEFNFHPDLTYQVSIILNTKSFAVLESGIDALKNIPEKVKQRIYEVEKHPSDCDMMRDRAIPFVANTLKIFTSIINCLMNFLQNSTMIKILSLNISSRKL